MKIRMLLSPDGGEGAGGDAGDEGDKGGDNGGSGTSLLTGGKPLLDDGNGGTNEPDKTKPEGQGGEQTKPVERVVPEAYELTMPDGAQLTSDHVQKVEEFARQHKFTQEEAQAILNRDVEAQAQMFEDHQAHMAEVKKGWHKTLLGDREFGGTTENFNRSVAGAQRLIDKFAPPELKADLDRMGVADYPPFMLMLHRIEKQFLREDSIVSGGVQGGAVDDKSDGEVLYPTHGKESGK